MTLKVTEYFPSIQGEGLYIGTPTYFVRLSGCNLDCVWCDTQYAKTTGKMMTEEDIWEKVKQRSDLPWVCITGGEPLLQDIRKLVDVIKSNSKMRVAIETNGTIDSHPNVFHLADFITVSPKMTNSGCADKLNREALCSLLQHRHAQLKFVCERMSDIVEALNFVDELPVALTDVPIVFQPQGRKFPDIYSYLTFFKSLWEFVTAAQQRYKYDLRCLPQLHVMLFGQVRGR